MYRERKALGAALTPQIVDSLEDRFDKSAITYIPNTAETAYYGLLEGLRVYRRKRVHAQLLEALRNGTLDENMLDSAILKRWPRGEKSPTRTSRCAPSSRRKRAARSLSPTYMTSPTGPWDRKTCSSPLTTPSSAAPR